MTDEAWLESMLLNPTLEVDFAGLAHFWQRTEICFDCTVPPGFQPGAWIARSVRGALGRRLATLPARPLPAQPYHMLFGHHARIRGRDVPSPLVIEADVSGDRLTCRLILFGFADIARDDVLECTMIALHEGIGIAENSRILRPWAVKDWHWCRTQGLAIAPWRASAHLTFHTPHKPGSSHRYALDAHALVRDMAARVQGMARWMSLGLRLDWPGLLAGADGIRLSQPERQARFDGFIKRARADPRGDMAVVGLRNAIALERVPEAIWPLLAFGEATHIGGHAPYGFGRFTY